MIGSGAADMIGMARAHIADPMIVAKWKAGREDEVRPCIGCNQGCAQNLERNLPITCFVNPMAGREGDWREPDGDPAPTLAAGCRRRGGPAGIEAAAVAASRGHRVTLLERGGSLGGRLRLAAGLRLRGDFGNWLEFSERRLARLGVDMHLQHDATAKSVHSYGPDTVILATGAEPVAFTLADGRHALTLDQAAQTDFAGACVIVYDETGDWGAMGIVEHLAEQGAKVTLATPVAGVLWRTTVYSSTTTLARWREKRIRIKTLRRPVRFFAGSTRAGPGGCVDRGARDPHRRRCAGRVRTPAGPAYSRAAADSRGNQTRARRRLPGASQRPRSDLRGAPGGARFLTRSCAHGPRTMKALVTGASGFLGVNLVARLLRDGHEVVALSLDGIPPMAKGELGALGGELREVRADVRDANAIRSLFRVHRFEVVFSGAAITAGAQRELRQPADIIDVNLSGSLKMLTAAAEAGVKRVVFASSTAAVGNAIYGEKAVGEEDPVRPTTIYGISKLTLESCLSRWAQLSGLRGNSDCASSRGHGSLGARYRSSRHALAVLSDRAGGGAR